MGGGFVLREYREERLPTSRTTGILVCLGNAAATTRVPLGNFVSSEAEAEEKVMRGEGKFL